LFINDKIRYAYFASGAAAFYLETKMGSDETRLFRLRLRALREAQGMSQGQLEERIGREANYITRVETGRIDSPPLDVIAAIARALDVPMSELFFFEGIDESADLLRSRIQRLIETDDVDRLRRYYRLMLVSNED
jgi:transcriptional regulator with XRE-family HTH domain